MSVQAVWDREPHKQGCGGAPLSLHGAGVQAEQAAPLRRLGRGQRPGAEVVSAAWGTLGSGVVLMLGALLEGQGQCGPQSGQSPPIGSDPGDRKPRSSCNTFQKGRAVS